VRNVDQNRVTAKLQIPSYAQGLHRDAR
jgi:hypothetical protein